MNFKRRLSRLTVRTLKTKVVASRLPAPLVSFTFDDALETAFTRGAALLEDHGGRGTFYSSGSLIESGESDRRFMTPEKIVALHRSGHEIGCHTFSHDPVATLSPSRLLADVERNQAFFWSLDRTIELRNFAYPYNTTSLRAKALLQRRFASCRGGVTGVNAGRIDLGFLRGVELCDELIDLDGVREHVASAARRGGWLVFLTHGVTNDPEAWRSTPRLFEGAIKMTKAFGCEIVTVREAMGRIAAGKPAKAAAYA